MFCVTAFIYLTRSWSRKALKGVHPTDYEMTSNSFENLRETTFTHQKYNLPEKTIKKGYMINNMLQLAKYSNFL